MGLRYLCGALNGWMSIPVKSPRTGYIAPLAEALIVDVVNSQSAGLIRFARRDVGFWIMDAYNSSAAV